jgi:DNA (cytosine-5)-methyltransferase 1
MAFLTFEANFLDSTHKSFRRFDWPQWLERRAWAIDDLLRAHRRQLEAMRDDELDVVAGGPPCQGFSFTGRRNPNDPRNQLFKRYLDVVRAVRPTAVLLENVPGMAVAHRTNKDRETRIRGDTRGSFYEALAEELASMGYEVEGQFIDASDFGVPQKRTRLIVVGLLRERIRHDARRRNAASAVFERLEADRQGFVKSLGLDARVSAEEAIGDLSVFGRDGRAWPLRDCRDLPAGFFELSYDGRRSKSAYQRLMHGGVSSSCMDSMRLARHSDEVASRFREIIGNCRQGVRMNDADRAWFRLRKYRIHPMSSREPAPTITTLPDDVLHFRDPRILTVRETARIQSFPDWFVFRGKYTTGGDRRKKECPRYTQVGNAVPPLLARAIGLALAQVLKERRIGDTPRLGQEADEELPIEMAA